MIQPSLKEIPDRATSIALCGKRLLDKEKVAVSVKLHPIYVKGECGIYEIMGRQFAE